MLVLSRRTESLKLEAYSCTFLQERAPKPRNHSRVSSGTRSKSSLDTRPFLQERAQKFLWTLARFFRNAPKNATRHLRISSGTRTKNSHTLARFFRNASKKSAIHSRVSSGTRPKSPRDTCEFLQERAQNIRETLVRFFRNAPKKSARHLLVSSGMRSKSPRNTRTFLQESAQKSSEILARFLNVNAQNFRERRAHFLKRTRPKNSVAETRARIFQRRSQKVEHT